jgi:hypothetical protein
MSERVSDELLKGVVESRSWTGGKLRYIPGLCAGEATDA